MSLRCLRGRVQPETSIIPTYLENMSVNGLGLVPRKEKSHLLMTEALIFSPQNFEEVASQELVHSSAISPHKESTMDIWLAYEA